MFSKTGYFEGIKPCVFLKTLFVVASVLLTFVLKGQCPTIAAILVDACPTGGEAENELLIIHSGNGFLVDDLFLDFDSNSNGFGVQNSDINTSGSPCGLQAGNPSLISGCSNVIPVGPGFNVPPNSYVVLQTSSAANFVYDFSGVCGSQQCVYVIQSTCSRTYGGFANFGPPATRTTILGLHNPSCTNSYSYDRFLLPNNNGAFFIPPVTYGTNGCAAPPVSFGNLPVTPVITGIPAAICSNASSIALATTWSGINGAWSGSGVSSNTFNPTGLSGNVLLTFIPNPGQCATNAATSIFVNAAATPSISGVPATVCQTSSPIGLPTTQSGVAGSWSGTGVSGGNSFNPSRPIGTYTLTFSPNPGLCANPVNQNITVTTPTPVSAFNSGPVCVGQTLQLSTSIAGASYSWSGPLGYNSNAENPSLTNVSVSMSGTYHVDVFSSGCVSSSSTNVSILTAPTANSTSASACSSGSGALFNLNSLNSMVNSSTGLGFSWFHNSSGTNPVANPSNYSTNGDVTVWAQVSNGSCFSSIVPVSLYVTPAITPILTSRTVCQNGGLTNLDPLRDPNFLLGTWAGNGVSGSTFDPSGKSGPVTLTFTSTAPCTQVSTTTVTVNVPAPAPLTGIPPSICQSSGSIILPTTQGNINGSWTGASGVSGGNTFNPAGLNGNISLTFTPNAGECASPNSTSINVITPSNITISGVPDSVCRNQAAIILPATQSGFSGAWNGLGVSGNQFNPAGQSSPVVLTFNPTAGQCANPAIKNVKVYVPVKPTITGVPLVYCQTDSAVQLPVVLDGINGNWSGLGVSANRFNPAGLSNNVTLKFTPASGLCADTSTVVVAVKAPDVPKLDSLSVCQHDAPFALSGLAGPGFPAGHWSGNGVDTVANTFNPSGKAGNFVLTFTPSNPCTKPEQTTIKVKVPPTPVLAMDTICQASGMYDLSGLTDTRFPLGAWNGLGVTSDTFNPAGLKGLIPFTFTPAAGICAQIGSTTLSVNVPPSYLDLTETCNLFLQEFTVSFNIKGGDSNSYKVNGIPVGGSFFTSNPYSGISAYTLSLDDAYGCGPVMIIDSSDCTCKTRVGNMDFTNSPIAICAGKNVTAIYNGVHTLEPDDTIAFVLHDKPGSILGNILAISKTPSFAFPDSAILGKTYYISAIGGNRLGDGTVDLTDPCLNVSLGLPITYYLPSVQISSGDTICANECFDFIIKLAGVPPFQLAYEIETAGIVLLDTLRSDTTDGLLRICPSSYSVAGGTITTSPISLTDANCSVTFDPRYSRTILVRPNPLTLITSTLCPGDSLIVNSKIYNQSKPRGTEVIPGGSYLGCDSTISLSLSYYLPAAYLLTQTLCEGSYLVVNGTSYSESKPTGVEVLKNASQNGCDSTIYVSLSFVKAVTYNLNVTICQSDSVVVNGRTYSISNPWGTETFVKGSYLGCDSLVIINLSFYQPAVFNLNQTLCPGSSIFINGQTFNQAKPTGAVVLPKQSYQGCDSTVLVKLSFYQPNIFALSQTLCPGDFIVVNGKTYNQANPTGTEVFPNKSLNGCDSIVNVNLVFYPPSQNNLTQTLCEGDSIRVNGRVYNQSRPSGTEILSKASYLGCDSTIIVALSFYNKSTNKLTRTLCPGDSLVVNGKTYNQTRQAGVEVIRNGSYLGCDSTINVTLRYYAPSVYKLTQQLCPGGLIVVNTKKYDEFNRSGTEILKNASMNGCDSTVHVNLTFGTQVIVNLSRTLCFGDSILVKSSYYSARKPTGTEVFTGGSYLGCDSVVNINLSFYPQSKSFFEPTLLQGQSATVNGTVYSQQKTSGTEIIKGGSYTGCDSIVAVQLRFEGIFEPKTTLKSPNCRGGKDGSITLDTILGGVKPFIVALNGANSKPLTSFPLVFSSLEAGSHQLTVQDNTGIIVVQDLLIPEPPTLLLELGADKTVVLGENVTLTPQTSFSVSKWAWSPPDYLSCTDCPAPEVIGAQRETTYTLRATNDKGCTVTGRITVFVNKVRTIFVPNIFSPNGDGINDHLVVFAGKQVVNVKSFRVFNRWGSLMHEAYDFPPNDYTTGWDGYYKGERASSGVYVWFAEIEYLDGQTEMFEGGVHLLE